GRSGPGVAGGGVFADGRSARDRGDQQPDGDLGAALAGRGAARAVVDAAGRRRADAAVVPALRPASPGFAAADKLTASLRLQGPAASNPTSYLRRFVERVRAIPGVDGVSASTYLPMSGTTSSAIVGLGDRAIEVFTLAAVTPEYFGE